MFCPNIRTLGHSRSCVAQKLDVLDQECVIAERARVPGARAPRLTLLLTRGAARDYQGELVTPDANGVADEQILPADC